MTDRDLTWSAYHESGHAVVGTDNGRRIHRISLRQGLAHVAITQWEPDQPELVALGRLIGGSHPLAGLEPEAFRYACRSIIEALAGKTAAELAVPTLGRQPELPTVPDGPPPRIAPATVTPRLLAAEQEEPDERRHDDDQIALDRAIELVGYETTGALLGWMRAETRRVCTERWPVIEAVAAALLATETLDAAGFGLVYTAPEAR